MALSVHSLASGSSGNSILVKHEYNGRERGLLLDIGISVKRLSASLANFGMISEHIDGIVITHEHYDHVKSAVSFSRRFRIPLIANRKTLSKVLSTQDAFSAEISTGSTLKLGSFTIETFAVPHDAADPVGVNILAGGKKVSLLTDLGCVTQTVQNAIFNADLLICETNHDVCRLKAGPYADALKTRILSNSGHLSNEAAVDLLERHISQKGPCTIWLAHLSKVNNTPKLALGYAMATLKLKASAPFVIDVARRDVPSSSWWPEKSALQLALF